MCTCIPFRLRQTDAVHMETANYEGTQCLTRNLPEPEAVVTGNSDQPQRVVSERTPCYLK